MYSAASKTHCLPVCGPVSPCDLGWLHFTCWRTWGVFDLCLCPSLLPVFEPELEFFVFSPGGVASTGLIQNTQTSCSTTPAATVSKPPPRYACLYPSLPSPPPPAARTRVFINYHLTHLSPWLPPCTLVSLATTQLHSPVPHLPVILPICPLCDSTREEFGF